MSLRNRIALAGGAVVLAALVLASLVVYPSLAAGLRAQRDSSLVTAAAQAPDLLASLKAAYDQKAVPGDFPGKIPSEPLSVGTTLVQFLAPPVSAGPTGFVSVSEEDVSVAMGEAPPYFANAVHDGVLYRVHTTRLTGADGVLVRTALPFSIDEATLGRVKAVLFGLTVGGGLLAAAAGRLAAGRVLRPVRRLTEAVEHVTATQDLTARIETRGRDEIARLARSFAGMMAALDGSVQAQRRLVADASHELRTPLTSVITNLELLAEGLGTSDPQAPVLLRDARTQAEELTLLVNDLIELDRHSSAQTHTEDTRLDLLARRVVKRAAARTGRVEFHTELSRCLAHVDPDAVERAVGNLVHNAVKYSPDGGCVTVRVDACGTISVTDQGVGIPACDVPFVFDRFYRSPQARSLPGHGLGLAIVRKIAETHGGTVAVEPLERGVRLRLWLPPAM